MFVLLDFNEKTAPHPATTGIKNQAGALLEKADPQLHDMITLMSALGNEHFEISIYTALITQAQALGETDAEKLFSAYLEQEQHTSDELKQALQEMLL